MTDLDAEADAIAGMALSDQSIHEEVFDMRLNVLNETVSLDQYTGKSNVRR